MREEGGEEAWVWRALTPLPPPVPAEWAGISEDFPEINATLVDKMLLFLDIRYVSDFIRQASGAGAGRGGCRERAGRTRAGRPAPRPSCRC